MTVRSQRNIKVLKHAAIFYMAAISFLPVYYTVYVLRLLLFTVILLSCCDRHFPIYKTNKGFLILIWIKKEKHLN